MTYLMAMPSLITNPFIINKMGRSNKNVVVFFKDVEANIIIHVPPRYIYPNGRKFLILNCHQYI